MQRGGFPSRLFHCLRRHAHSVRFGIVNHLPSFARALQFRRNAVPITAYPQIMHIYGKVARIVYVHQRTHDFITQHSPWVPEIGIVGMIRRSRRRITHALDQARYRVMTEIAEMLRV
jgi:hypothetical protein